MSLQFLPSLFGIAKAATEEEKAENFAQTLIVLEQLEEAFKKCSGGEGFFGGDSIGFLDVTLGSQLAWIKTVEKVCGVKLLDETKAPLMVEWVKRFLAVDFVKRVIPSMERVEELLKLLLATKWKAS